MITDMNGEVLFYAKPASKDNYLPPIAPAGNSTCKYSEETRKLMNSRTEYHFRKEHIFINFSFHIYSGDGFNKRPAYDNYIHHDHKVHIYLSYADFIDDYMWEFVKNVGEVCNNKVTIHMSKRDADEIIPELNRVLGDLDNWKILTEYNSVVTAYRRFDNEHICVGYNFKKGVDRIICTSHKTRKDEDDEANE